MNLQCSTCIWSIFSQVLGIWHNSCGRAESRRAGNQEVKGSKLYPHRGIKLFLLHLLSYHCEVDKAKLTTVASLKS